MDLKNILPAALALLLLSSCMNTGKLYDSAVEKAGADEPLQAVIVPGIPFDGENWDRVMQMRVLWAVQLFEQGVTENIIFSGSSVYSPYVEAQVMALYAEALGVPTTRIFLEPMAEHSTENLFYGSLRAKELGFDRIGLATDPFQMTFLKSFNKRLERELGVHVDLVPIVFDELQDMERPAPQIDASSAKVDPFVSLPDRQSFWKRFRGTMGQYVDWDQARDQLVRATQLSDAQLR